MKVCHTIKYYCITMFCVLIYRLKYVTQTPFLKLDIHQYIKFLNVFYRMKQKNNFDNFCNCVTVTVLYNYQEKVNVNGS